MTDDTLPPLPANFSLRGRGLYTANQIQSYARAARAPLLAERTTLVNAAVNATERAEKAEARLAAAEALLKEARRYINFCRFTEPEAPALLDRIDAFLSHADSAGSR